MSSLRFSVLSSGSSGNATFVESDGRGLLMDAGISCRRLKVLLRSIGRSLDDVGAILLTHGHSDHTSGLRSILRERRIAVISAPGVGEPFRARIMEAGSPFRIGGLEASFFEVPHDARTYGIRLRGDGASMAMATDLGEVSPAILEAMRGVHAAVLEANHDAEWLELGPYPVRLKRRIAAANGHLSNRQAADAALALASGGLTEVVLAHLSKTNNSPARACGTLRQALRGAGYGHVRVRAAIAGHPTPWVEVGEGVPEPPTYVYRETGKLFGLR